MPFLILAVFYAMDMMFVNVYYYDYCCFVLMILVNFIYNHVTLSVKNALKILLMTVFFLNCFCFLIYITSISDLLEVFFICYYLIITNYHFFNILLSHRFILNHIYLNSLFSSASFRSHSISSENLLPKEPFKIPDSSKSTVNVTVKSTGGDTVGSSKPKRRIKAAVASTSTGYTDSIEWTVTLAIMNVCMYNTAHTTSSYMFYFYLLMMNIVVGRTLLLRNARVPDSVLNAVPASGDATVKTTLEREELTTIPEKLPAPGDIVMGTYARTHLPCPCPCLRLRLFPVKKSYC